MRRALVLVAALLLACATPAAAEEPGVDLVVTASFDKASYQSAEDATLTVTITNVGAAPATGVAVQAIGDPDYPVAAWGAFDPTGPGGSVGPGEEVVLTVTARPFDPGDGISQTVRVSSTEPDQFEQDNEVRIAAGGTDETCDLAIVLYGDADRDGRFDQGEALVGVVVAVYGTGGSFNARTGGDGRVQFTDIPCHSYSYRIKLSAGWLAVAAEDIKTRPGVLAEQVVRAVRNEAVALAATIKLDRDVYAPGDPVRERVTVTNRGPVEVAGILATCGQIGPENELYSIGWGDLDPSVGKGLRLGPGETRSFEFAGTVPPQAWDWGFVVLRCNFAIAGGRDGASAEDRAAVPGGRGSLSGTLAGADRVVLPGVKVMLTDQATGVIAARAVTGADGRFQLPECAAGEYELRLVGPWRFTVVTMMVQVFAGRNQDLGEFKVLPGPSQPDPDVVPTPPVPPVAPAEPVPQAAVRPANLADTGVSVRELTLVAVLLLTAGGALAFAGRRNCRW